MNFTDEQIRFIQDARQFLENPNFLVRAASFLGKPLEKGAHFLPAALKDRVRTSVRKALDHGLDVVTKSVPLSPGDFEKGFHEKRSGQLHTVAAGAAGAVGGFFGALSLPIELPMTTAIMLRSIVSTAADFGHDIHSREIQLECLYVLSLGSGGGAGESAYWTSRVAFLDLIRQAARESSAPLLLRFIGMIASRFELVVSEKAMAQLMPVIGAVGGAAINAAFSDHFVKAARFHFGLRALEKSHGEENVRAVYLR